METDKKRTYEIECGYPDCKKIFVVSDPCSNIPQHPFPGEYVDSDGNYLASCPGSNTMGRYIGPVE